MSEMRAHNNDKKDRSLSRGLSAIPYHATSNLRHTPRAQHCVHASPHASHLLCPDDAPSSQCMRSAGSVEKSAGLYEEVAWRLVPVPRLPLRHSRPLCSFREYDRK